MEEYQRTTREDQTPTKESGGKSSKRKTRAVPLVGGLAAAEGSIWQREREEPAAKLEHRRPEHSKPDNSTAAEPESTATADEHRPEQAKAPEADAERLDTLTPAEARQAALQYVDMRAQDLAAEIANEPADAAEEAAVQADKMLLDSLRDKLASDEANPPGELIEEAYNETAQDLSEPADIAGPVPVPGQPPLPPEHPGRFMWPPAEAYAQQTTAPETSPGPDADTISRTEAAYYERQAESRGLLVGGIVGYLIGRRRGRIKSEKRLLPVQHKLEKQVSELHRSIADKERQVRTLAAQRARRSLPAAQPELKPVPIPPESAPQPLRPDVVPAFIAQETPPPPHPESPVLSTAQPSNPEQRPAIHPEQLSDQDALELSKNIVIDGTSLRETYESKRITQPGLRHVVSEYLRGGDVKRILEQEILIKELTFERDPQVRPGMSAPLEPASGSGPMLPLAAAAIQSAQLPAPVTLEAAPAPDLPPAKPAGHQLYGPEQTIMRAWVAIIVLLAVIAVVLVLR